MVVVSLVVGVLLAVASVPVGLVVSNRVLRSPNTQPGKQQLWLDQGDHQIFIYHWRDAFRTHWESSIVPEGTYDPPGPEFERPVADPRPHYARRAYTGHVQSIVSTSAGWPWSAASGRGLLDGTPSRVWSEWQSAVKLGSLTMRVPVRPIWPGLLANTVFYAGALFGVLVCLRVWRTRRRRARGRCVACNYQLGEGISVCPECGLEKTA